VETGVSALVMAGSHSPLTRRGEPIGERVAVRASRRLTPLTAVLLLVPEIFLFREERRR
jgi:hypothetical protein